MISVQRFAVCDQCGVINRQRGHHLHGADEARLHSRPEAGPQRPWLSAPGYWQDHDKDHAHHPPHTAASQLRQRPASGGQRHDGTSSQPLCCWSVSTWSPHFCQVYNWSVSAVTLSDQLCVCLLDNNNRLFMVPHHLVRAQSAYKDVQVCSLHTHARMHIHAHKNTHTPQQSTKIIEEQAV